MEKQLVNIVQNLGQRRKTGCLQIIATHLADQSITNVFFQKGNLVYCEVRSLFQVHTGLHCLAFALLWPDADTKWIDDRDAPRIAFNKEAHAVLFRIASLEKTLKEAPGGMKSILNRGIFEYESYEDNPAAYALSLHVLDTEFSGQQYLIFEEKVILGRKEPSSFVIPHGTLSSQHCSITIKPDHTVILEDLGSTNGTYVNEVLVRETRLFSGDRITLGDVSLIFCVRSKAEVMKELDHLSDADDYMVKIVNVKKALAELSSDTVRVEISGQTPPQVIEKIVEKKTAPKQILGGVTEKLAFWRPKEKEE